MAIASVSTLSIRAFSLQSSNHQVVHPRHRSFAIIARRLTIANAANPNFINFSLPCTSTRNKSHPTLIFSSGSGGGNGNFGGGGDGGGSGGGGGDSNDDGRSHNRTDAILALAEAGRSLESLPKDLATAVEAGRVPGAIVKRYFELEKSPVFWWLLQFGGFKERLLADDLFLTKVAIECGVGVFTKVCLF
ncbi:hypothetical protein Pint_23908 [Pistacia integerrima]|uniref:Uncharacterized protein n=1 Tax=Pistacia integerrima TaxID=434235 RepID=A0ACC0YL43_9ROSI|nr:hypothetical protein Pint_23908 [Pistacia integerrima]